ncbi:XRE family transcriptional regulator [Umezawaea sp. Da 62-37]|uniref:helix-turn-helix domain-containing protein n=1 Tax=Umezawaea sp. Da 62-37 TaxID=3075927 RepID=UPI0028F72415|nr:XRE family transcriptional regulator [Umezawaea sp. Da 62-37]WNV82548.1 XRE family transcriptional regulator [Umezawaea sp. Da 62-37]
MTDVSNWVRVGERIRSARQAAALSQVDLGEKLSLDRTMIAKIEAGTRRVDAFELSRLSAELGVPLAHFLHDPPAVLSRRVELDEDVDTDAGRQQYRLEALLQAWLRDVLQLIDIEALVPRPVVTYPLPVDSDAAARAAATWLRSELGLGIKPISSLMDVCEQVGQFVLVTELPGNGASVVEGAVAAAVVSSTGDPGRRRATAAHELGHLVLGDEYSSDLGVHASRGDRKAVMDAFAAELLLPTHVVLTAAANGLARTDLVRLAATYRVSWVMAMWQAAEVGALDSATRRLWKQNKPTKSEFMEAVGWEPQPDLDSIRVPRSYAQAVLDALRQRRLTSARAVELLHGQLGADDLPTVDEEDVEP